MTNEAAIEFATKYLDRLDAIVCTREWSAWGYGTMTADDFEAFTDTPANVTGLVLVILAAALPAVGELETQIQKVRDLHERCIGKGLGGIPYEYCSCGHHEHPCPTIKALGDTR